MSGGVAAVGESEHVRRTRESYDAVAADYVPWARDDLAARRWTGRCSGGSPSSSGTGRSSTSGAAAGGSPHTCTRWGVDASGIDLSPRMVDLARAAHPDLRFSVGSMTDLALPDASVRGLLAYHSTIHVPDERTPQAYLLARR